jgi:Fe-S-cluster-containing dehydrogenase component/formate-dependent nitrite reductase membrane component NrfD
VEKGEFPNTRRLFSVMRCNHCTDAPCVEICPVEALFIRPDGIVDFDNDRCIGCKSCMQACPYDALYIDPKNNTAAKCNYCAHRIDVGLEPACVNVCPEHAIISGDMDDPDSEIAELLSRQAVKVRKPEKNTVPNLFYIDADDLSLDPSASRREEDYMWSSQSHGVGHYAKEAEKLAFSNGDVFSKVLEMNQQYATGEELKDKGGSKSIDLLLGKSRRVYDAADKGIMWGWEVSAYVWTKAISAGVLLFLIIATMMGHGLIEAHDIWYSIIIGIVFLGATGLLLVKDLDRPDRFLYVLLRPQWNSWLVKGGYGITAYGGLLALLAAIYFFKWTSLWTITLWAAALVAIFVAIYTAFLFAQAKGRDFWQSPTLAIHMLVHSVMAGAAMYAISGMFFDHSGGLKSAISTVLLVSIAVNLITLAAEMLTPHPTKDATTTSHMITRGRYKNRFWGGVLLLGNILPLGLVAFIDHNDIILMISGILVLIGIYITEFIWVEAPQRIALS